MLAGLALRPLTEPDEGRNAEVAREMAASGDYALPRLNGLPYVDKPALYYAAVAGSFKLFGVSEWSARLPSVIATLFTALLIGGFARYLFRSVSAGAFAAGAMLAAPLTWIMSQLVILDALFALWVVASLIAFYLAVEAACEHDRKRRLVRSVTAWIAIALAVLTKGPVGLLLPLLVAAPYAAYRRAVSAVFDLRGVLFATALVAPWVWMMSTRLPGYLHYVALVETWQRIATDSLRRTEPVWFYVPILLIGTLPCLVAMVAAAWRRRHAPSQANDARWVFLSLWIFVPLVFFSLASSKMPQYVLPIVPAFALAAAGLWSDRSSTKARRPEKMKMPWVAILPMLALYFGALPHSIAMATKRSSKSLAMEIRAVLPEDGRVVAISAFPLTLPFYLGHPVTLASANAAELSSNYLIASYRQWVRADTSLEPIESWRAAAVTCRKPTVFIVSVANRTLRASLAARLPLLGINRRYVAYGPCHPASRENG
jgi:4-amino-4-deoxy-L-arabinose transferase-like glycosyltransferase